VLLVTVLDLDERGEPRYPAMNDHREEVNFEMMLGNGDPHGSIRLRALLKGRELRFVFFQSSEVRFQHYHLLFGRLFKLAWTEGHLVEHFQNVLGKVLGVPAKITLLGHHTTDEWPGDAVGGGYERTTT
jgi:hypothetical protein